MIDVRAKADRMAPAVKKKRLEYRRIAAPGEVRAAIVIRSLAAASPQLPQWHCQPQVPMQI
jgi:hypothetical protein